VEINNTFYRLPPAQTFETWREQAPQDFCYALLRNAAAALCIHDLIADHPRSITADWVYLRFHGVCYGGSYTRQALTAQARRIAQYLDDGLDVFAYFNNDTHGYAVYNAAALRRYVWGNPHKTLWRDSG
jgi:uncharacterized protein YecE (DUF72 family)